MKHFERLPPKGHDKPCRNVKELAAEFGVTFQGLGSMLAKDPTAPKKRPVSHDHNAYYDLAEARAWWAGRKKA